jgi:hypothetical protein
MIAIRRILVTAVTLSRFAVPAFTDSPGVSARGTAPAGSIYIPNRSVTVNGVVTSGGRPVSSARVRVVGLATGSDETSTTNSSGYFSTDVKAAPTNHGDDRYLVTVSARGYFPSTTTVRVQQSHFSTIGVHLSPDAGRLYGTVLSPVSAPASDAAIRLVSEATGAVARTRAGRDGSFSLATPPLPYPSSTDRYEIRTTSGGLSRDAIVSLPPSTSDRIVVHLNDSDTHMENLGAGPKQRESRIGTGHGSRPTPNSRHNVQPTPVPSCPATGETSWTGLGGNNAWETNGNWTKNAPTASTYACITTGTPSVTINSTAKAAGLLLGSGASVTVQTGALDLQGSLTPSAI